MRTVIYKNPVISTILLNIFSLFLMIYIYNNDINSAILLYSCHLLVFLTEKY